MPTSQVLGTIAPERSRTAQARTWCPQGPVQPAAMSAAPSFFVGSLHSGSILMPNAAVGVKVPDAVTVVDPLRCGSTDCPSAPWWVISDVVLLLPLLCQKNVAVLPCVWNAANCRTATGWLESARSQYGLSTSSPLACTSPCWF